MTNFCFHIGDAGALNYIILFHPEISCDAINNALFMFFQVVDNADELIIIFACNHLNRLMNCIHTWYLSQPLVAMQLLLHVCQNIDSKIV